MKTVVTYARLATRENGSDEKMKIQIQALKDYCKKNGLHIIGQYQEYGSGISTNRPEFKKMLQNIKNKVEQPDYILCENSSRISKNAVEYNKISRTLNKHDVKLIHINTIADKILQIFSQNDHGLQSMRIKAGIAQRLKNGEWCLRAPEGYEWKINRNGKNLSPNKNAKYIKKAFELKATKGLSNREITERLSRMGYNISSKELANIFSNKFYCGKITHSLLQGETVIGKHPPIISESLFIKANQKN